MSNEIISAILILLTTLGGAIGLCNDPFTDGINDNVDDVHNVVLGVADSQAKYNAGLIGVGQWRQDWQDAQQYIGGKYRDACKDTDLSPEQRELNDKYKEYLLECNQAVIEFSEGKQPVIPEWDN